MKPKIVELLSESLKRQDRQEEILEKQGSILERLADGQEKLISEFHKMNDYFLSRQD
ncbi:MAG: hypothetical protein KI791_04180 [Cyclobacteriaceae bacterium]|nr:hypothetical protein [Cyclobacteriaceae bacterium SS2]